MSLAKVPLHSPVLQVRARLAPAHAVRRRRQVWHRLSRDCADLLNAQRAYQEARRDRLRTRRGE
jgi:hypothetical protein